MAIPCRVWAPILGSIALACVYPLSNNLDDRPAPAESIFSTFKDLFLQRLRVNARAVGGIWANSIVKMSQVGMGAASYRLPAPAGQWARSES